MPGEDRPWLFATIPSLHSETQLYTARRSNTDSPQEYKMTLAVIAAFLVSEFGFQTNMTIVKTVSGSDTHGFTANQLFEILVIEVSVTGNVKVGTSAGSGDIWDADVTAGTPLVLRLDIFYNSTTTIHFTGNFTARLYIR